MSENPTQPNAIPRGLEFGIANFKAFGPKLQSVKLKPLTLVFGPNSSGKSSLIHSLLWLKDVIEGRLDVFHPSAAGGSVDLGGFKQCRHGNDPRAEITTYLALTIKDARQELRQVEAVAAFATCHPPADYARRLSALVEERFRDSLARNGIQRMLELVLSLEEIILRTTLTKLLADEYGEQSLELHLKDCFEGRNELMRPLAVLREEASPKLHQATTNWFDHIGKCLFEDSPTPAYIPFQLTENELLEGLQAVALAILNELGHKPAPSAEGKPSLMAFELHDGASIILKASRNDERQLVLEAVDFDWLARFTLGLPAVGELKAAFDANPGTLIFDEANSCVPAKLRIQEGHEGARELLRRLAGIIKDTGDAPGILDLCELAARTRIGKLVYLAPLRAYPERGMTIADLPINHDAMGLHTWRRLGEDSELRSRVNQWLQRETQLQVEVDHLVHWAQVRERVANEFDSNNAKFWLGIRAAAALKDDDADIDEALATTPLTEGGFDAGYLLSRAFDTVFAQVASETTGTIHLRKLGLDKPVSSRDIGLGISQVIPELTLAMDAQNAFIAIEQPEIHLHPALQAQLGDAFIDSALTRGNTLLLETHSEHLILRIMRRIRETFENKLPEGAPPITPDDVSILYVEPGENGCIVREMPLNERGELVKGWPGGFFEEAFNEMFS